ncbi:MAG: cache domain-containing protein, partial [Desulfovibrio sp.]|nr:cache domain-containing protein [Desulfovibrio sp.]
MRNIGRRSFLHLRQHLDKYKKVSSLLNTKANAMPNPIVFSRNKILFLFFASIFLCFLATTAISLHSLSKVIDANDQNEARLVSTTIHSHIREFLSTHISAAKTMAEDFFLKKSLHEDAAKPLMEPGVPEQTLYLSGFVRTTGIDTAYIVSDATHRYFSHRGLHKVIDPGDAENPAHEHDTWYPAFIETGMSRNIQIDINPDEGDEWTLFFNNRIDDDDGTLLGVCGVGIRMARLQSLLRDLEKRYGVEIRIVNDADTSQIDSQHVLIDKRYLTLTESVAPPKPMTFHS